MSRRVLPLYISTRSRWSAAFDGQGCFGQAGVTQTTNWVAGLAVYIPVYLPFAYPVKRVFWVNGSSVTGNIDFGIYTPDGAQVYHTGNTAQASTNVPQYVTPGTPFVLDKGSYLFAVSGSSTGRFLNDTSPADRQRMIGVMQQASANPLPNPATFATMANALYPLCGVTRTTGL